MSEKRDTLQLKSIGIEAINEGKDIIWTLEHLSGEKFKFSSPSASLPQFVTDLLLLSVLPNVAKYAPAVPPLTSGQIEKVKSLPVHRIGTFIAPMSDKVGFDIELVGGIRLIFQFLKTEALKLSEQLRAIVDTPPTPTSCRRH